MICETWKEYLEYLYNVDTEDQVFAVSTGNYFGGKSVSRVEMEDKP